MIIAENNALHENRNIQQHLCAIINVFVKEHASSNFQIIFFLNFCFNKKNSNLIIIIFFIMLKRESRS